MDQEKSAGIIIYCIENKEPKFLLLKNTFKTTYYSFPKGIIESGEQPLETAIREVKEETNLDIKKQNLIPKFKYIQSWFYKRDNKLISKQAIYFLAKLNKEQIKNTKISNEHESFSWLTYKQALDLIKIKSNKEMLTQAYKTIKEFEKQKTLF